MNIVGRMEDSCACFMEKLQFGSKLSAGWSCCLPGWLCSEEVLTDLLPGLHHCWVESEVSFRDETQRPQNVCDVCNSLNLISFYVSSFIPLFSFPHLFFFSVLIYLLFLSLLSLSFIFPISRFNSPLFSWDFSLPFLLSFPGSILFCSTCSSLIQPWFHVSLVCFVTISPAPLNEPSDQHDITTLQQEDELICCSGHLFQLLCNNSLSCETLCHCHISSVELCTCFLLRHKYNKI